MRRWIISFALVLGLIAAESTMTTVAVAEDKAAVDVGTPTEIVVEPVKFELNGTRSYQQLIVTGKYANGDVRDLTTVAMFTSSADAVAKIENGVVKPATDGSVQITATVGTLKASVDGTVKNMAQPSAVSFKNQMIAALSKSGCNMGACHGSPSGKGGFRLSLRGYDPVLDIMTLRSEFYGRRTNAVEPGESLLLKKPLMEVAHGGGRRLKKNDPSHKVMLDWVGEGLRLDQPTEPDLVRIQMIPESRTFQKEERER